MKDLSKQYVADMIANASEKSFAQGFGQGQRKGRRDMLQEVCSLLGPAAAEYLTKVFRRDAGE